MITSNEEETSTVSAGTRLSSPWQTCATMLSSIASFALTAEVDELCTAGGDIGAVFLHLPSDSGQATVVISPTTANKLSTTTSVPPTQPVTTAATTTVKTTSTTTVVDKVLIRINAGGPQVPAIDNGPVWQADDNTGHATLDQSTQTATASTTNNIVDVPAHVPLQVLQTERYAHPDPKLSYVIDAMSASSLTVNLYMAEVYAPAQQTGKRLIDVVINGVEKQSSFDTFARVGANTAVQLQYANIKPDSNGKVTITIQRAASSSDTPRLQALEVFVGTAPPPASTIAASTTTTGATTAATTTPAPTSAPGGVRVGEQAPACASTASFDKTLSPGDDVKSIVESSPPGTRFRFTAGQYSFGNVRVKSNMVLCGAVAPARQWLTVVDGKGSFESAFRIGGGSTRVDQVTIGNFNLHSFRSSQVCDVDQCRGLTWRGGAIIMDPPGTFIDNWASAEWLPDKWLVQNNYIHDMQGGGVDMKATGFRFIGNVVQKTTHAGIHGILQVIQLSIFLLFISLILIFFSLSFENIQGSCSKYY